jgi:hypothetical protein
MIAWSFSAWSRHRRLVSTPTTAHTSSSCINTYNSALSSSCINTPQQRTMSSCINTHNSAYVVVLDQHLQIKRIRRRLVSTTTCILPSSLYQNTYNSAYVVVCINTHNSAYVVVLYQHPGRAYMRRCNNTPQQRMRRRLVSTPHNSAVVPLRPPLAYMVSV